jgi:hypothetical protein
MSVELSPSQERRLHSILDRGLEALHDSRENTSNREKRESPNVALRLEINSEEESPRKIGSVDKSERNTDADELRMLRERLSMLEAKVMKSNEPASVGLSKRSDLSPGPSIRQPSQASSRGSSGRNKSAIPSDSHKMRQIIDIRELHESRGSKESRNSRESRECARNIENSEKELTRLERSITPSPARRKNLSNSRQIEKVRVLVEKERKLGEKLRRENEALRKELSKREELKTMIHRLQDEYNELAQSFERSEAVRKKQKELIQQLKSEILMVSGSAPVDNKRTGRNIYF